ncbi:MAG TPA: redoxin family protein [Saprospiraceae bacterium]|nr:redoxin family protein [Saprospiraceae bacterium]
MKYREVYKYTLTLCVIALITFFGVEINKKYINQVENNIGIYNLPKFNLKMSKSKYWESLAINDTFQSIFIYFNPNCEHCHYQLKYAKEVVKEKDVHIIFVANVLVEELKKFVTTNDMQDEKNIIFLSDEENNFSKIFHTNVFPSIFIYGKDKKLKKRFNGETKAEAILKYLE